MARVTHGKGEPVVLEEGTAGASTWEKNGEESTSLLNWPTSRSGPSIALCMDGQGLKKLPVSGFFKLHDKSATHRISQLVPCQSPKLARALGYASPKKFTSSMTNSGAAFWRRAGASPRLESSS